MVADSKETLEAVRYANFAHLSEKHDKLAADYELLKGAHNRLVREHNNLVAVVAELQTLCNRLRRSQNSAEAVA
jgi:SPX domain protein involved in polyphosphate accumulation